MNPHDAHDSTDLVTTVIDAFESMPVPPAPALQETIDALERAKTGGDASDDVQGRGATIPSRQSRLASLTTLQRMAVGGIGLSAIAALVVLAFTLQTNRPLAAMERMAARLSAVRSYRYRVHSETVETDPASQHRTSWIEKGKAFWHTPDAFYNEDKIVKIESKGAGGHPKETGLENFVEVCPHGDTGIFIDHKRKTFFHCRCDPTGSTTYPLEPLKLIREDNPPPIRNLGTRQISGKTARGYIVSLTTGFPRRRHDWQVWIDPETDLPVELSYQVDDHKQPRTTTVCRITDFHWNEPVDPKRFKIAPPEGYREIEPPKVDEPAEQK